MTTSRSEPAVQRTFTLDDPACRRTLARLRWCKREMMRSGIKLAVVNTVKRPELVADELRPSVKTDVTKTWARFGWKRKSKRRAA